MPMYIPETLNGNKVETAASRLHTSFTELGLIVAEPRFPGLYETIGRCADNACETLRWLGCDIPLNLVDADISIRALARETAEVCADLRGARTEGSEKRFRAAFATSASLAKAVLCGHTQIGLRLRRDDARRAGTISGDAQSLLMHLIDIEDSFARLTVVRTSAVEHYARHGRIMAALEKFHLLSPNDIAQLASAMRNGEELRLAA